MRRGGPFPCLSAARPATPLHELAHRTRAVGISCWSPSVLVHLSAAGRGVATVEPVGIRCSRGAPARHRCSLVSVPSCAAGWWEVVVSSYVRPHYDTYKDLAEALKRRARALDLPCHLCGRRIDWDADWREPQAYTYDHDVPLVLGGDPRGPGKQSHRSCNSRRNASLESRPKARPRTSTNWGAPPGGVPPSPSPHPRRHTLHSRDFTHSGRARSSDMTSRGGAVNLLVRGMNRAPDGAGSVAEPVTCGPGARAGHLSGVCAGQPWFSSRQRGRIGA